MTFQSLHRMAWLGIALGLAAVATQVHAVDIALVGRVGSKAIVSVGGGAPRVLAPGASTREGVRLISVDGDRAVVEVDGRRRVLEMGAQPIQVDQTRAAMVTLYADERGHFSSELMINGATVPFIVDTGASFLSIGKLAASKAGIEYRRGRKIKAQTANGVTDIWVVRAKNVKLGAIEFRDVETAVFDYELPTALLGMTVLRHLDMRREAGRLTLRKRI